MAGIGFTLRTLARKDDLLGIARAFTHAAFATVGPSLFVVLALVGITVLYASNFIQEEMVNFRAVIIYNFSFSLVISAAVYMVIIRYMADYMHFQDVTKTPSIMIGSLVILILLQLPLAIWFWFYYTDLTLAMRLSAFANLFLNTAVWLLSVFLTALKDYKTVTRSFLIGMIVALVTGLLLKPYGATGMLNGFNLGMGLIVFILAAKVFSEYPYKFSQPFSMMHYFRRYWEVALAGVFYNAGIWVDKWIMWFAPESWLLDSNMRMYPDYDSAMFFAYLTIVPAMATFTFSVETNFFERYRKFYYDILGHVPLSRVRENHRAIIKSVTDSARNLLIVQGVIAFLAVVLASQIFELLNINYAQIGIFRLGVIGSFFQVLALFGLIILSYFDHRRPVLYIQMVFFLSNAFLTYLVMVDYHFPFYGTGYLLSCMLTFAITAVVLFEHIRELPYHAFISNNNSVILDKEDLEKLKGAHDTHKDLQVFNDMHTAEM